SRRTRSTPWSPTSSPSSNPPPPFDHPPSTVGRRDRPAEENRHMSTASQTKPRNPLRPTGSTGLLSWMATTDHKRIGVMYFFTVLVFFTLGGIESGLIRLQLSQAENAFMSEE